MKAAMKMLKASVILFACILILGSVSATTITQGYNAEREAQYTPPNALQKLLNFISSLFGNELFSIAGERWQCEPYPYRGGIFTSGASDETYFAMTPNSLVKTSSPEFCGGSGLFDTFVDWIPQTEYKNSVDFYCPSTATGCQLQLYCCDHFDCSSNSDCTSWFGSGYTCEPTYDTDPSIDFDWSFWKYCKLTGIDPDHRCWRNVLGYCEEKQPPYKQSWIDANGGKCPISWLYESLPECEDALPTCKSSGQSCSSSECCSGLTCSGGVCTTETENGIECRTAGGHCYDGNLIRYCPDGEAHLNLADDCEHGLLNSYYCCKSGGICTPSCTGKVCGNNGCDGSCGTCATGYTCNSAGQCVSGTCPSGQIKCSDGTCREDCGGDGAPPTCIDKEGVFYSDGYASILNFQYKFLGFSSSRTTSEFINSKDVNELFPGFSAKYFENRRTACCDDLVYLFDDEKTARYTQITWSIWSLLGLGQDPKDVAITYSTYVCKEKSEVGFCIDFMHRMLNPYTKTDDCQQNTIIFVVLIVFGFIAIARFAG